MKSQSSDTSYFCAPLATGYLPVGDVVYMWPGEWWDMERLKRENREIGRSRKAIHDVYHPKA